MPSLARALTLAFSLAICLVILFGPSRATALDINEARRDGAVLAESLRIAETSGWAAAEAHVAGRGDALLADIVLWRKLRAGRGTEAEYHAFVARRPGWPGLDHLASAVLGRSAADVLGPGMSAAALQNWRAFDRHWSRRDYDEAERLLDQITGRADNLGDPERWADQRRRLARRAAREGRPKVAYRLAAEHHLTEAAGYDYSDLEWIAGWVALRRLNDPARALTHFDRFLPTVTTPISLGRGHYWRGRALAALGRVDDANDAYAAGALHQTSFYGQLAAAEIGAPGDPSLASGDLPDWRLTPALRTDDVRLALVLEYAGEEGLAFQTFDHLGETLPGGAIGALGALALEIGRPNYAVRMSKSAARRGIVMPPSYYPVHDLGGYVTKIEPALALSLARQETELNPKAISPAGARGLMQLMPATAQKVSDWISEPYDKDRLTEDWRYNARLGQTYLARRIQQFGGSYVMAAAAYNAGASRVEAWSLANGDPRNPRVDIVDWIESIPFDETRNYVQRVMEGIYIYRARLSGQAGPMTIRQDLARGAGG